MESEEPALTSFESFAERRSAALLRYGVVLTGNAHDAADLTQEALVRLAGAWPRIRRGADPEAYVRTTMARQHISWWRKRQRERLVGDVPERGAEDVRISGLTDAGEMWDHLAALGPRQRAVLVLRYVDGLTDAEIAHRLRISTGTVRSQAHRALATLRTALRPAEVEGTSR